LSPRTASVFGVALVAAALTKSSTARAADDDDPSLGVAAAAAIDVAGFVVGSAVMANGHGRTTTDNEGWLTLQGSFVLSPFVGHAAVGEWGRGAAFAIAPACAFGGTAAVFAMDPGTVENGTLPQQRWMWSFFTAGLLTSALGTLDIFWAPARAHALSVTPVMGGGELGLRVGGTL